MDISTRKILNFLFMDLLLLILSKKICGSRYALKRCTMEFSFLYLLLFIVILFF